MIIVSSRKNFIDPDHLTDGADQIQDVAYGKTVGDPISMDDFLQRITDKKVLVLVHGYNNEPEETMGAYELIQKNIQTYSNNCKYDEIIGYSWPGGNSKFEYFEAKSRSNAVGRRFRGLFQKIKNSGATIDLMAHSMGNRVVLNALNDVADSDVCRNFFSMAAAVDNECLEAGEEFYRGRMHCERVFVFYSRHDTVLKTAYTVAEFDFALGLTGPEDSAIVVNPNTNLYAINCKKVINRHGAYKREPKIFQYLSTQVCSGIAAEKLITL